MRWEENVAWRREEEFFIKLWFEILEGYRSPGRCKLLRVLLKFFVTVLNSTSLDQD